MSKCKSCKFDIKGRIRKTDAYDKGRLFCRFITEHTGRYRGEQRNRSNMKYLNGDGKCPYYTRKWWKFWITEDK